MTIDILRWITVLVLAFAAGKLMTKLKMPSILGWLIIGMLLGPHAIKLLPQSILDTGWYKIILMWMQCAFGLMLGSELIWKKMKHFGRALVITTLTQSLGTFAIVSLAFGILFAVTNVPVYLAFVFGGIALATAPAPALSIVNEFHAKGPVTDTLLPMTILDDVVGIVIFFTINSLIAREVSSGAVPLYMIPFMIFLPVLIGTAVGFPVGLLLQKSGEKARTLAILLSGITVTMMIGWLLNTRFFSGITLNYMLMGVSFSAVFSNMLTPEQLDKVNLYFSPILGLALLTAIVDLGAPLDYHLILGAGLYTFIYIAARAIGKYFGARSGAMFTHMPDTVCKYLGLTLLPHSGVSLVFTGIICSTLVSVPELVQIVQGTIAAAIINEFIAVVASKKGFELANEIQKP
ncbi:MAG: potassium transporter [Lachnospiraceae bacterium]|nr:potassium transporter [Lachnospiraceae bacterium]